MTKAPTRTRGRFQKITRDQRTGYSEMTTSTPSRHPSRARLIIASVLMLAAIAVLLVGVLT